MVLPPDYYVGDVGSMYKQKIPAEGKILPMRVTNFYLFKISLTATTDGPLIVSVTWKSVLQRRKVVLDGAVKQGSVEMDKWVELTEKSFNFACYARAWFKNGDNNARKAILACLGSNLIMKDRKIHIELHPFFKTLFINKNEAEQEIDSARTDKTLYTERQKGPLASSCPTGLACSVSELVISSPTRPFRLFIFYHPDPPRNT